MDRRTFNTSLAGLFAATALSSSARAKTTIGDHAAFTEALKDKPWLIGYLGTREVALNAQITAQTGKIPVGLEGDLFRNGPALHSIGPDRFGHWFDAPGMAQRFRFAGGTLTHRGRLIETARNRAEAEAERILYFGFGTHDARLTSGGSADGQNVANINFIEHAGELLALWEGGSAHVLDPETMETRGRKVWSPETKGLPFGAHSRRDRDGSLWNIGYLANPAAVIVYHISAGGALLGTHILPQEATSMVHDFVITDTKIVIMMPPYRATGPRDGAFIDLFQWDETAPVEIVVLDKSDLTQSTKIEADPFWVFHFGNAYDISPTEIGLDFAHHDDPTFMIHDAAAAMDGSWNGAASAASRYTQARLDLGARKMTLDQAPELGQVEFIQTDQRAWLSNHRYALILAQPGGAPVLGFTRLLLIDRQTGQTSHHDVSANEVLEEHLIVPKPGQPGFWIVGTALDWAKAQTNVAIYDGEALADGPLFRAELDTALPLGLHGTFLPRST